MIAMVGQQARRKHERFKNEMSSAVQSISARPEAKDAEQSFIVVKNDPRQKNLDDFLSRFEGMRKPRSEGPGSRPPKEVIKLPENMPTLRPKTAPLPRQAL